MSDIKVSLDFICPSCNEKIEHGYVEEDLERLEFLELTCDKCNTNLVKSCYILKEKAIKETIEGFKISLEKLGYKVN